MRHGTHPENERSTLPWPFKVNVIQYFLIRFDGIFCIGEGMDHKMAEFEKKGNKVARAFWLVAGVVCVVLGAVGIVLLFCQRHLFY